MGDLNQLFRVSRVIGNTQFPLFGETRQMQSARFCPDPNGVPFPCVDHFNSM